MGRGSFGNVKLETGEKSEVMSNVGPLLILLAALFVPTGAGAAEPTPSPKSGDALRLFVDRKREVVTLVEVAGDGLVVRHARGDTIEHIDVGLADRSVLRFGVSLSW